MNWKIESRGGRQAVPTRDETNTHNPHSIAETGLGCQAQNDKLFRQVSKARRRGGSRIALPRLAQGEALRCVEPE